jgi:hypothetical protein
MMIFVQSIMDSNDALPVINSSNKGADLDYGLAVRDIVENLQLRPTG